MSEPNFSPFGYDVNKHQKPELVRHLQILTAKKEFNGKWNESMRKPELLYIIEKHHAQARERAGENPKDYLKEDFEPEKCTNAKLRQIFAQYDIKYPAQNPKKEFLVEIFEDNISKLRTLNKRVSLRTRSCVEFQPLTNLGSGHCRQQEVQDFRQQNCHHIPLLSSHSLRRQQSPLHQRHLCQVQRGDWSQNP